MALPSQLNTKSNIELGIFLIHISNHKDWNIDIDIGHVGPQAQWWMLLLIDALSQVDHFTSAITRWRNSIFLKILEWIKSQTLICKIKSAKAIFLRHDSRGCISRTSCRKEPSEFSDYLLMKRKGYKCNWEKSFWGLC